MYENMLSRACASYFPFYFDTHTIVGYYLYEILRFYKEIYMRLRNIPGAGEVIDNSPYCIKEPVELKGNGMIFRKQ